MDRQEILNRLMAFPYDRDEYWVITAQKSSNAYSNHSTTADFFLKNAGTR